MLTYCVSFCDKTTTASDIIFAIEYSRFEENRTLATHDDIIFFAIDPERCYYGMLGDETYKQRHMGII